MKQPRALVLDIGRCTGCRLCETVCSLHHAGAVDPGESRIRVVKEDALGLDIPIFCQQCEHPACVEVCPALALSRDEESGVVRVDSRRCLGCLICVMSCPIGAILSSEDRAVKKCDLCGGEPRCSRYCPTSALRYLPLDRIPDRQRREAALRMAGSLASGAEGGARAQR